MRGRVREVVIYFKFHENRSRGLRAVEGRKSPSPIDLAHGLYTTACTAVQAVMKYSKVVISRPTKYAQATIKPTLKAGRWD